VKRSTKHEALQGITSRRLVTLVNRVTASKPEDIEHPTNLA
jgi:hypothetical protein